MPAGRQPEIGYFAAGMDKMRLLKEKATLTRMQYLVWAAILLISFFGMLSSDGARLSAAYAIKNTCFYALIIYGNIHFMYPPLLREEALCTLYSRISSAVAAGRRRQSLSHFGYRAQEYFGRPRVA